LNSIYHRLGIHDHCTPYFCSGAKIGETNIVPDTERAGIMVHIRIIVYRLSVNADSLIESVDNNLCEQLNSLINKHIGGKRIIFTQKNTYTTRVETAVVAFNSKNFLRSVQKKIVFKSPGDLRLFESNLLLIKKIFIFYIKYEYTHHRKIW